MGRADCGDCINASSAFGVKGAREKGTVFFKRWDDKDAKDGIRQVWI